ncbi:MAG: hypothetical protein KY468_11800 [Armatimonadetes bacterium]|nr:hypothetical protein [Armatimonadota bacterium]
MSKYAARTEVPITKTRDQIEKALIKYGAEGFAYGWEGNRTVIGFKLGHRRVRIELPLPTPDSDEVLYNKVGANRPKAQQESVLEQLVRQRWRALLLVITAKLEAVESGITTIEDEFLSGTVLPDGSTFGQWAKPRVEEAYTKGLMPALLPGLPPHEGD